MSTYTFKALIHKERFFIAECPELGIEARGRNIDEALACLRIETIAYLATLGDIAIQSMSQSAGSSSPRQKGVIMRRYTIDQASITEERGTEDREHKT